MKKYLPHIISVAIIIVVISIAIFSGGVAHAAEPKNVVDTGATVPSWVGPSFFNSILASIVNTALGAASVLLNIAAALLNVSVIITLHISDFVNATPAIFSLWQTIRDITGLFFIFVLLYAAIQMILGIGGSYKNTLKSIVIAAFMVNFSFFVVSLAIDASNIISAAIFNAILPQAQTINIDSETELSTMTQKLMGEGGSGTVGISDIFMNSLKIQSLYDPKTGNLSGNSLDGAGISNSLKIIFIGVIGTIITITTALSFVLAAIAFIVRIIILLFLLAFSPIWFAGAALPFPEIKGYVKKFKDTLYSQLLFMPVYMLLMYAALSVLNSSNIMGAASATTSALPTGTNWAFGFIVLGVNFAMVIIMLNLPLVVGLSMGGAATSVIGNLSKKWSAENIWRGVGNWGKKGATGAYNNTAGRAASLLERNEKLKDLASNKGILGGVSRMALKGTRSVATDYNKKLADQVKSRTDFAESLGYDESKVAAMRRNVTKMRQDLNKARSNKDEKEEARLKAAIKQEEQNIDDTKNARQLNYAGNLETPGVSSIPNLGLKVPRKDMAAAARIKEGIYKKQLEKKQKQLDEKLSEIKSKENEKKQYERGLESGQIKRNNKSQQVLGKIESELSKLRDEEGPLMTNEKHGGDATKMGTNDLQEVIDNLRATK